ncbi:MAG: hypothetical protein ABR611_08980 [Chthoniobacterales bacterium]
MLLIAAACCFAHNFPGIAWADPPSTPPPIPSPPPSISVSKLRVQPHRVATVTYPDQSTVLTRAAAGTFQMLAARPGELVTVVVPIPVTAVPVVASVQALDGGYFATLPSALNPSSPISPPVVVAVPVVNGKLTFNFQAGTYPGLYRVLVQGIGRPATLQFWVQNVQQPKTNPWAVNSSHWQSQ